MKSRLLLASLVAVTPLWFPYGAFITQSSGNPDWQPYSGDAGSLYDAQANPAQTVGTVSYDPYGKLPSMTPATPSGSDTAMTPGH